MSASPTSAAGTRPETTVSIRSAVIWSYALTIGRYSVTAGVTLVMAILLAPREFGVMALAVVWVWFAQSLSQHGPAMALVQREVVTALHIDAAFWVTTATSVALAGALAALAPLWATINGVPQLATVCWALTPAIVLNGMMAVPDAIMRRELRFKALSVRVLVGGITSGGVGIGLAAAGYGVWALVAQQLTISAVSLVAVWVAVSWRPGFRDVAPAVRDLRRFSVHSVAEFLAFATASRADALLLGSFIGPVALGLYRFSNRLVEMVMELAAGGLNQVTVPHLSRFGVDRAEFAARLGTIMHLGMAIALPALGILAGTSTQLLAVLGPEWSDAAAALRVLCLAGAFMVVGTILAPAIQALGRPGTGAVLGWAEAVCMVGVMLIVGGSVSSEPVGSQVTAVATTVLVIQVAFVATTAMVTFRMILREPIGPALRRMAPAAVAGSCGATAGWGVAALLPPLTAVLALLAVAAAAAAAAAAALLTFDRTVQSKILLIMSLGSPKRLDHEP